MPTETMPVSSYAVLGLLSQSPASGYDLAQRIEASVANFWPMSKSNVYAELARLESLKMVEGSEVSQVKLPNKRVFRLTEAGTDALDAWLQENAFRKERRKNSLLVKVMFADRLSEDHVTELIEATRREAESERAFLAAIVEGFEPDPSLFWARSTALFGLLHAEATLAWADEMERALKERTHPLPS